MTVLAITPIERRQKRADAHHLNPVVLVGAEGLTPAVRKEVDAARRNGFSIDRGNYVNGVTIVAVPLLNVAGQVSHALVAAGVSAQRDPARSVALASAMREQAQAISASIAARG